MSEFASLTLELDTTPFEEALSRCEDSVLDLDGGSGTESGNKSESEEAEIGTEFLRALESASLTDVGATLETISGQLSEISTLLNQIAGEKSVRFELVSAV